MNATPFHTKERTMKKALLLLPPENRNRIYGRKHTAALRRLVDLTDCCDLLDDMEALAPHLADAQIICSGWGMVRMDEAFLAAAPALEAVFYGAGSVRGFVTDAFWERDILLTSAWAANAVPVIEMTLALITMGMKKAFQCNRLTCENRTFERAAGIRGLYGARIGVIGVGQIGRGLLERLKEYDVETCCYDPYLDPAEAAALQATPVELEEMFATCDVVSVHAPNLPSTRHMIRREHFRRMKEGAVFINTARGAIVHQDDLIEELRRGRIFACLDVTDPEPPQPESRLYALENVFLTPHLAGSQGDECLRQGAFVVEEVRRYCSGEPPQYPVTPDMMAWMA